MARRVIAPLAPELELSGGYVVRLVALDPTTGAAISGVAVSGVTMQVVKESAPEPPRTFSVIPPLLTWRA